MKNKMHVRANIKEQKTNEYYDSKRDNCYNLSKIKTMNLRLFISKTEKIP
uniref:Uncharacterized protein n=1 Tax=Ascaris lumbricoides TaxID=6252 RepID=A0A0M3ICK9_ASCLU